MEIKRPVLNIPPELREINLGKEEEKKTAAPAAGIISTADSLEIRGANRLTDAIEAAQQGEEDRKSVV